MTGNINTQHVSNTYENIVKNKFYLICNCNLFKILPVKPYDHLEQRLMTLNAPSGLTGIK